MIRPNHLPQALLEQLLSKPRNRDELFEALTEVSGNKHAASVVMLRAEKRGFVETVVRITENGRKALREAV